MISFQGTATTFLGLLSLFSPAAALVPIAALTVDATEAERRRLALRVTIYYLSVVIVSLWIGHYVLLFLGISTAALTATGGVALFVAGLPLMTRGTKAEDCGPDAPGSATTELDLERLAVVPITFPITIGGATVAYLIAASGAYPAPIDLAVMSLVGCAVAAIVYGTIRLAGAVAHFRGALDLLARISGIVLVALSMEFFFSGVSQLYSGTTHGSVLQVLQ